ncbi:hypothetical protein FA15DRAFT_740476 [Coprinopsis marcescibilis]|uniref:DNA breaking-rejoining enzyme n=1 Tax=Coprinopsis marcescibilis TaxID=230819 RepID=A0A5C3L978_COPMA|nr:hypothetical protein FA15DRAFT_740476 [Coprinopsis marcescibilis]
MLDSSRRKKCEPWTVEHIAKLKQHLDLADPLHVAVFACLMTAFYRCARLGEFMTRTLKSFNPTLHVKPMDVREEVDQGQRHSVMFHLPRTKASQAGEDVSWAKQDGETDPDAAFQAHLDANEPPQTGPLFAYTTNRMKMRHKPLTKVKFLAVMHLAAIQAGLEPLKGHGIRIGSTLEYLFVWNTIRCHEGERKVGQRCLPGISLQACPNTGPIHAGPVGSAPGLCVHCNATPLEIATRHSVSTVS